MRISVVVPIYNAEKYLAQCIESLIKQTYSNIQIILVNDGSQDNSLSICKKFAKRDPRIIVLDQKNQGVSVARNNGIDAATGQYIGFVDSDDYVEPDMYKTLLDKIQLENSDCVTLIDFTIRPANDKIIHSKKSINNLEAIGELFLLRFPTSMCAYLYKTDLVKKIKLSTDIHFFEDFEFNFNYLKACKSISIHRGKYYHYSSNQNSINHQEISTKKLSCLRIYDRLSNDDDYKLFDENLNNRAIFLKAHFIISMILSFISSSKEKQQFYYQDLYENVIDFKSESFLSKHIPISYKILILMFAISPPFTSKIVNTFKSLRGILKGKVN